MSDNLPDGYYPQYCTLQLEAAKYASVLNKSGDLIPSPGETEGYGTILQNNGINAALTIDGATPSVGDRVLLVAQTDAKQNGTYIVLTVGDGSTPWQLVRAPDMYYGNQLVAGMFVIITGGATNNGKFAILQSPVPTSINDDPINFFYS
jgi:hypothetical protein